MSESDQRTPSRLNDAFRSHGSRKADQILIQLAVTYRTPLSVTERFCLANGNEYPVCPRCHISLDREYMNFCDRCGQALDWAGWDRIPSAVFY